MTIAETAREIFENQSFWMHDSDTLIEILKAADDLYYNDDESFLTDEEYDYLYRYVEVLEPSNVYFTGVGSDVRGGKVKLPYTMGSLDQIYEGEICDWVRKWTLQEEPVVMTDKLDGASAMVIYDSDGKLQIAYSRGNGTEGADITRHLRKLRSVPEKCDKRRVVRGEVIIEMATFHYLCQHVKTRANKPYKNPRNMVSGLMNAKKNEDVVYNFIKFVAYEIVGGVGSKEEQLRELEELGFEVPHFLSVRGKELSDDYLTKYLNLRRQDSIYEIDGLVLDVNSDEKRKAMNPTRETLNPAYAVKYKVADANNIAQAKVLSVKWNLSKHGYIKPRVNIEPVNIGGVTINYATGFNAKFIYDNGIGRDAIIEITRAGDVIPFIQRVIKPSIPEMPAIFEWDWDWSVNDAGEKVDAVIKNPDDYKEVVVKRMTHFFEKIEAPMLKEGNVQKLYESEFKTIDSIIRATIEDFTDVLGENGKKAYKGLHEKLKDIPLYKILGAYSTQRGIGVRKMKKLQKAIGYDGIMNCNDVNIIANVDGFDKKTAMTTLTAIDHFMEFWHKNNAYFSISADEATGTMLSGEKVCMTGFRDKELAAKVEEQGGEVQSAVSGKTTILVAKDPNSNSGKVKKAREAGTRIMGIDEFKQHIGI
jgi:NAD-dependent DNA ligase